MAIYLPGASGNKYHEWTLVLRVLILDAEDTLSSAARTSLHGSELAEEVPSGEEAGTVGRQGEGDEQADHL